MGFDVGLKIMPKAVWAQNLVLAQEVSPRLCVLGFDIGLGHMPMVLGLRFGVT